MTERSSIFYRMTRGNEDGGYYAYLPLDKKCLLDEDSDVQQEEFNNAALSALKKTFEAERKIQGLEI